MGEVRGNVDAHPQGGVEDLICYGVRVMLLDFDDELLFVWSWM